ncbi:MAG: hypothetical protein LBH48_07445 [Bifidobacteriaceae bacterium]|jgi:hypothetical protein|nr:hypothetical protein [Bifidobacteriaceae bacterium]
MSKQAWEGGGAPDVPAPVAQHWSADAVAAAKAVAALEEAIAFLDGARPVKWVAPSVSEYVMQLNALRGMCKASLDLAETVSMRVKAYNHLLEAERMRSAALGG